jgi:hypothetical protein
MMKEIHAMELLAFDMTSGSSTILLLLGLMIVTGTLLLRSWKYFNDSKRRSKSSVGLLQSRKNKAGQESPRRNERSRPSHNVAEKHRDTAARERKQLGKTHEMVSRWEIDMHELSRELSGKLDSKMTLLQTLIAEGQRVADRLDHSLDRFVRATSSLQESSSRLSDPPSSGGKSAGGEKANVSDQTPNSGTPEDRARSELDFSRELGEFDRLASTLREEVDSSWKLPEVPEKGSHGVSSRQGGDASAGEKHPAIDPSEAGKAAPSKGKASGETRKDLHDHIYMLADYGFSLPEIASRAGRPAGEVELVLSLRQSSIERK